MSHHEDEEEVVDVVDEVEDPVDLPGASVDAPSGSQNVARRHRQASAERGSALRLRGGLGSCSTLSFAFVLLSAFSDRGSDSLDYSHTEYTHTHCTASVTEELVNSRGVAACAVSCFCNSRFFRSLGAPEHRRSPRRDDDHARPAPPIGITWRAGST
jgi:hypothetical protein